MRHDLHDVCDVMGRLEAHGITTWLFGGWAEELHGLTAPRDHDDVDLLYPAASFALVDRFLQLGNVQEIVAKHLPHKRAFTSGEVMTEIILVQPDLTTTFWHRQRYAWPSDVFGHRHGTIRAASPAALTGYRAAHGVLHEGSS